MNTRIKSAIEQVEYYMFLKLDNGSLSKEQKKHIIELMPLLPTDWYNEANELIQ